MNTGTNDRSMISTLKTIGRPTVRSAGITTSRVSPATSPCGNRCLRWCVAFSTITIAWSTSTPTEIVIPARDMMFACTSTTPSRRSTHINANENSTDSGSVTQMTNALRTCERIKRIASAAITISCHITSVSVRTAANTLSLI